MLSRFNQFLGRHSYSPTNVDDVEDGYHDEDDEGRGVVSSMGNYYQRVVIYITNLGSASFGATVAPFGVSMVLISLLFLVASVFHTGTVGYAHPISYDYEFGNKHNNGHNYSSNNSTESSTSTSTKSVTQNVGEIIFSLLIFSIIISCLFGLSRLVAHRIRLIRERAIARGAIIDQLFSFQNDRIGVGRSGGDRQDELAQMINMLYSNRDFNGNDYEMLQRLDENIAHRTGVSESALSRLPTHRYTAYEIDNNTNSKCSICLAAYEVNDSIKTITCLHSFHTECIDRWLREHDICPVCKYSATGNS